MQFTISQCFHSISHTCSTNLSITHLSISSPNYVWGDWTRQITYVDASDSPLFKFQTLTNTFILSVLPNLLIILVLDTRTLLPSPWAPSSIPFTYLRCFFPSSWTPSSFSFPHQFSSWNSSSGGMPLTLPDNYLPKPMLPSNFPHQSRDLFRPQRRRWRICQRKSKSLHYQKTASVARFARKRSQTQPQHKRDMFSATHVYLSGSARVVKGREDAQSLV